MYRFLHNFMRLFHRDKRRNKYASASTTVALAVQLLCQRIVNAADVDFEAGVLDIDSPESTAVLAVDTAMMVTLNGESLNVRAGDVRTIRLTADNPDGVSVDFSALTRNAFRSLRNTEITTGPGNDNVIGSFAADDVFTELGDDLILGSSGYDTIDGGDGLDKLKFLSAGGTFIAHDNYYLMSGPCRYGRLFGIDQIDVDASTARSALNLNSTGFTGDMIVVGSPKNDRITTGAGDDIVDGWAGKDNISTKDGNDVVLAFGGTVETGNGDDFVDASGATSAVTIYDKGGNDFYILTAFNDKVIGSGASGDDVILAGAGNDTIDYSRSTSGNLTANGESGNDVLRGGAGHDLLSGDDGDDALYGNAGDDQLFGGFGKDFFDGGTGNNTIDDPDGVAWDLRRRRFRNLA